MYTLHNDDCLTALRDMPDNSVDSIVTDPPYGLSNTGPDNVADTITRWATGERDHIPAGRGFMGQAWDGFVPPPAVWKECLRVLKPGGHMAVFAGARTQDLMGLSIRLAGFEIRDTLGWVYSQGFPKSMDVSKAIDKAAGAESEVVGSGKSGKTYGMGGLRGVETSSGSFDLTTPATSEAEQWSGWGTALKPAIEPIILARKPLDGTVAANVLAHGVGGLNIDACRVPSDEVTGWGGNPHKGGGATFSIGSEKQDARPVQGRFPANVLLDEHAAEEMDEQSGWQKDGTTVNRNRDTEAYKPHSVYGEYRNGECPDITYGGSGGASRFFPVFKYQAKAPKKERPVIVREDGTKIQHPTVKPLALMSWLVTLITPPGGVMLDPFAGSGTTLQVARDNGFQPVGIEADSDYCLLIEQRMNGDDGTLFAA